MGNLALCIPYTGVAISASVGSGVANLATDDPREAWAAGATTGTITLDLGSAIRLDTILLGYTNCRAGATYDVTYGTASATETVLVTNAPAPLAANKGAAVHIWMRTPQAIVARYIAITVRQRPGASNLLIGIARVGMSWNPLYGHEWGGGRPLVDTGTRERLATGGFAMNKGVVKSGYGWTFGNLSEPETDELYALAKQLGETGPVIIMEDDSADADHYRHALTLSGTGLVQAGGTITKSTGTNGWNASASSAGSALGAMVSWKATQTDRQRVIGLCANPANNLSWLDINYAILLSGTGNASACEEGVAKASMGTYVSGTYFAVIYDGDTVYYLKDNAVIRSALVGPGLRLFIDSSFNDIGASVSDVQVRLRSGYNERLHWCVFDKLQTYERRNIEQTRFTFSVEDWL